MITIATMTMLFLPGTFVSAILSMSVFDNSGLDARGRPTLKVLPQWWIFPVATVVLTGFVVTVWRVWQLRRLRRSLPGTDKLAKPGEDEVRNDAGDGPDIDRKAWALRRSSYPVNERGWQDNNDDAGVRPQKRSRVRRLLGGKHAQGRDSAPIEMEGEQVDKITKVRPTP